MPRTQKVNGESLSSFPPNSTLASELVERKEPLGIAPSLDAVTRLKKDLANKTAIAELSKQEVRFLVDSYYSIQEYRKAVGNQLLALEKSGEPNSILSWLFSQHETLENQVKKALDWWTDVDPAAAWAKSITGIGPVIAAGLSAHIDITKAPTAGHIWSYAGIYPGVVWAKGEKRPWNAALKGLTWKIGQSFIKVSGNSKDVYGQVYLQRRTLETQNNFDGKYSDQAVKKLQDFKIGKDTEAYQWYAGCLKPADARLISYTEPEKRGALFKSMIGEPGSGLPMLPPAHILARAQRYAAKLFLAHYHEVAYTLHYKVAPPNPYPIAILGHAHKIEPPNFNQTQQ